MRTATAEHEDADRHDAQMPSSVSGRVGFFDRFAGGASGLGEATVRMLVAQGAKVTILDINDKTGNALAAELGANVKFLKTDVTDSAQVQSNVEAAVKQMGGLHFLVTTAGIGIAGRRAEGR